MSSAGSAAVPVAYAKRPGRVSGDGGGLARKPLLTRGGRPLELWDFAGNVGLALLLGVAIGAERQFRQHPAGLRTTALVSVGAALFVSLTPLLHETTSPSRIASYIVSGVGFLGGGVILKEGANVRGITTAATLWCSAAVGTLAGAGFGVHAAIGTAAVLLVVAGLRPLARRLDEWRERTSPPPAIYHLLVNCDTKEQAAVRAALLRHVGGHPGMVVAGVTVRKKKGRKRLAMFVEIETHPGDDRGVQEVVNRLLIEHGVTAARWEKVTTVSD